MPAHSADSLSTGTGRPAARPLVRGRPGHAASRHAHGVLRLALAGVAVASALATMAGFTFPWDRTLPRIVFVARQPLAGGAIPGVGPAGRTAAAGGRLMVRERNGRVHPLVDPDAFHDVSDPGVSWDGKRVAFAATPGVSEPWRIYVVGADGTGLRRVTHDDRPLAAGAMLGGASLGTLEVLRRYDDFDPCWLPDGRLCFASTRLPQLSQHGGYPVSNLYVIDAAGGAPVRITTDRNGAEEPSIDPRTGRIVYARWWFNRFLPADSMPSGAGMTPGITTDRGRSVPADTVNLWHAVSVLSDGDGLQLAGGDPRERRSQSAYQPIVLRDGTLVGVAAEHASLVPAPGTPAMVMFPGGLAERQPAVARVLAPVLLPDDRLLVSMDADGDGDFALYALDRHRPERARRVADVPGMLDLDAAVLAPRKRPVGGRGGLLDPPSPMPHERPEQMQDMVNTFRFDCLNVFANGAVDTRFPDAPPIERNVRIRFYGVVARPGAAGGDSIVLVREAAVLPNGAVHEDDMPADVPMFEQLVDSRGRVLRSARGPAHVPGLNFARLGSGTKCVGCHAGHSALPVPPNYSRAAWLNAAPSAIATASSIASGTRGPQAAVDRRTRGPLGEVAWVANGAHGEWIRLSWSMPIEVRALVLYACRPNRALATDLRVGEVEVRFYQDGVLKRTEDFRDRLRAGGTRFEFDPIELDALEIRPSGVTGTVLNRRAVGLAEVEAVARLIER